MAKVIPDARLDVMLDQLEGTRIDVCSAEPTTYTEATSTYTLATTTLAGGDYTAANGDTSGRKNTIAAKTGVSITGSGTATHVCVTTSASSRIEFVTTCTSQALTSGGTVDIGSFKIELADPS